MTDGRRTVGLWRNLWRYFTKVKPREKLVERRFVGEDINGNKYFFTPKDKSLTGREARIIEPSEQIKKKHDFLTSYGMDMEIPVEWNSWLRGLRKDPPTPEEIERNEFKKLRLAERVRLLEMKEAEERASLLADKDSDQSAHVATDVQNVDNPKKVPFPKYGDTYEPVPGVTKNKKPND